MFGVLALIVFSGPAAAQNKCAGSKIKAAGKKASCLASLEAKEASKGEAADPLKVQKCKDKYSTAVGKAEAKPPCLTTGDVVTIENKVDAFVDDVDTEISGAIDPPATTSKCQSAKLKAAGKKAKCLMGIEAKVASKGDPADPLKVQKCKDKFSVAFSKAEGSGDCGAAVGDTTTIENKVDAFVDDAADELNPPPAVTTTTSIVTTTTSIVTTTTTTTIPGPCCGINPSRLSFTTGIGTGNCGTIQSSTGAVTKNLACSGLYTGGGGNTVPLPYNVPDMGQSLTGISSCVSPNLTLTNLTSGQTGSNRNCTSVGCLFGPPLPIPNSVSTPTSVCVINIVATNASGSTNCVTGASTLNLPLTSQLYLTGDLYTAAPGIQVCPVCNRTCTGGTNAGGPCNTNADCPSGGTCGGANVCHSGAGNAGDGNACTPADSVQGTLSSFPTSHDCPPPAALSIGGLPIAFNLTTGTQTKTGQSVSGMSNVFCGYCVDINAGMTGCFEGDPDPACPINGTCVGAGNPWNCCTGVGVGTCNQGPKACTAASQCTDGAGTWPDCQQNSAGAFGPAGGGARTITETGSPAGNMTDGAPHASTLASIFCIQPTFNATVDAAGDLPGPGAVTLQGQAQLLP